MQHKPHPLGAEFVTYNRMHSWIYEDPEHEQGCMCVSGGGGSGCQGGGGCGGTVSKCHLLSSIGEQCDRLLYASIIQHSPRGPTARQVLLSWQADLSGAGWELVGSGGHGGEANRLLTGATCSMRLQKSMFIVHFFCIANPKIALPYIV